MKCSERLQAQGLHIDVVDDRLIVKPRDLITPEVRAYIRSNKNVLLDEIRSQRTQQVDYYTDPFRQSGEAIKVYLPPLDADVWFCSDEQAKTRVQHEELACFLCDDLVYIHQGKPGAERLSRLYEIYAKRHPVTTEVLKLFNGKITSISLKSKRNHGKEHPVSD